MLGGGIVGLAVAWQYLQRFPGRSLVLLEKETEVGQHQTGHNSGCCTAASTTNRVR
ncbi:MAG: FAD-dependent oxidoreductase [Planctomycetota bacterium]